MSMFGVVPCTGKGAVLYEEEGREQKTLVFSFLRKTQFEVIGGTDN